MQTEPIQILIEAVEGNAAALQDIQTKLGGIKTTTEGMQAQQASLGQQFKASWMEINSAIGVAKQAYQLLKGVVDETVGTFVKYADQVRTISQVTGQSSEAVSRIIQLTDDYKIRTETLNIVMKKMATEGNALTIDSLAQLSDEYLKLAPGVERQTFLTKNFGREGVAFAEIMLAGGKAIRTQSDAISDNLILTDEAVRKARDYEKAQDDLSDAMEGLKIVAGELATGPLIKLVEILTRLVELTDGENTQLDILNGAFDDGIITVEQYNARIDALGLSTENYKLTAQEAATAEVCFVDAAAEAAAETANLTSATETAAAQVAALKDMTDALSKSYQDVAWEALLTHAAFDGLITPEETDALLNYGVQLGIFTSQEAEAKREALNLQAALAALPPNTDITLTMWIIQQNRTIAPGGPQFPPIESGGGGEGGGGDWVRAGKGWEKNTKTGAYRAAPNQKASGGSFSGWAMVGDKPGGGITPYTEWVYAPQGATVYNQAQIQSAPPMAAGGEIPPAGTIVKRQINLYDDAKLVIQVNNGQTIDEVVDEVMDKLR